MDTPKHPNACIAIICALAACGRADPPQTTRALKPEVTQRAVERDIMRTQLLSELQEVDQATARGHQGAVEAQRRAQAQAGALDQLNSDMQELQTRLKACMLDHKLGVAALAARVAGTTIALDAHGTVSQESKEMATLLGAVAMGWAVFKMDEVVQVGQSLLKVDALMTDFKSRAPALLAEGSAREQALHTHERELARLGNESAKLRSARASL